MSLWTDTVTRVVTLAPLYVAVTSTTLVSVEIGSPPYERLTLVLVPLLDPVKKVLLPLTRLKLHDTLLFAKIPMLAVPVASLYAVMLLVPLAGLVVRTTLDQTRVDPTYTAST